MRAIEAKRTGRIISRADIPKSTVPLTPQLSLSQPQLYVEGRDRFEQSRRLPHDFSVVENGYHKPSIGKRKFVGKHHSK